MKKISLNETLNCAYRVINNEVLGIKASTISICSDIDRYFRLRFNFDISIKIIDSNKYFEIIEVFPKLSNLPLFQFNHLLDVFRNIRDINAHLYLCRDVTINNELCKHLLDIAQNKFDISKEGKLTMYGQAFILSLLAQKYNLWPFYTSYYKRSHFFETNLMKGDKISLFHIEEQHKMQKVCGIGNPINTTSFSNRDLQYLNDVFKKNMTNIVFNIEKDCSYTRKSKSHSKPLASYLKASYAFDYDEESYNRIVLLRNYWFHGVMLNECIEYEGKKDLLSFEFVLESFIRIKSTLKKNEDMFYSAIDSINKFANEVLNYYVLRFVEVSYKLLDSRLLIEDKLDSRIDVLINAYSRLVNTNIKYFELLGRLIDSEYMAFNVSAPKFSDKLPRNTACDMLQIIKLYSKDGFEIGDFKTYKTELYLVLIDLDKQFQNKINGQYISDIIKYGELRYGNKIAIYENTGKYIVSQKQDQLTIST